MATGFQDFFNKWILVTLVVFSLLAFIISFQLTNNVPDKISNNSLINGSYSDLNANLNSLRDKSQTQKTLFETENPTTGFGSILLFSIISSGKVFNSMIIGTFNILIKLPAVVLGVDPVVFAIISTVIIITIILGLWIVYKLGG